MSARVERKIPAKQVAAKPVVVDFDLDKLEAPLVLRCGALLIDYIFLVSIPIISLIISKLMGIDQARLLNNEILNIGWLVFILFGFTDFLVLPLLTGQSIGKMLTGLKIVNLDGTPASFTHLLLRHLIGYPISLLIGGLGFFMAVFTSNGRALHDFLAGTVVVYGTRQALK